jgi:hypothetical protein
LAHLFLADSDIFYLFANFGETNFHFPEFSGVFGEKRRKVCYWENRSYRKPFFTFFGSILGIFSLLEPMEQVAEPTEVSFSHFQGRGA